MNTFEVGIGTRAIVLNLWVTALNMGHISNVLLMRYFYYYS